MLPYDWSKYTPSLVQLVIFDWLIMLCMSAQKKGDRTKKKLFQLKCDARLEKIHFRLTNNTTLVEEFMVERVE